MSCRLVVSGPPGVGKTTLIKRVVGILGNRCGGFYTEEVREGKRRVGFVLVDVITGEREWLAREGLQGPRIGRYGVNVGVWRLMEEAIERGMRREWIVLDEIGPMEFKIPGFSQLVDRVFSSGKNVVATAHRSVFENVCRKFQAECVWMDFESRDKISASVLSRVGALL